MTPPKQEVFLSPFGRVEPLPSDLRPNATRMADFWPLFSDDVRASTDATDDAFDDHHDVGAVGSFDDELVRANIHSFLIFCVWFARVCDARAIDRVRCGRWRRFGCSFVEDRSG